MRVSASTIAELFAWEALDSRGSPTVACEVRLHGGAVGTAIVPSGASTGRHEVRELRDGGSRYAGKGVQQAVLNVLTVLADAVVGMDARDQDGVDAALVRADGTGDLGRLGGNAVLSVSVANALAAASATGRPAYRALADPADEPLMPRPMVNVISGGAHAGGAVDVQDFLVVPVGAATFGEALEWSSRVRRHTAELVGADAALVADEGGLGPRLPSNRKALELLSSAIENAGLSAGSEVGIAVDVAASQFLGRDGRYHLRAEDRVVSAQELVEELERWCDAFPIVSIEDPLGEDDWSGWAEATRRLGAVQLVGDDLFVTDAARLRRGVREGVANAVLVKPNQIGTLSRARDVIADARAAGYATVLSARSGETEDSWLADLAVAWRTGQIKVGSTMRSERTAKWNRLLRIEADLATRPDYGLPPWRPPAPSRG